MGRRRATSTSAMKGVIIRTEYTEHGIVPAV